MKIKVSDIPVGGCFSHRGKTVKKISETRCASASKRGKVRKGKCPSASTAESAPCSIDLLGAGLSGPTSIVEMGSASPRRLRRR